MNTKLNFTRLQRPMTPPGTFPQPKPFESRLKTVMRQAIGLANGETFTRGRLQSAMLGIDADVFKKAPEGGFADSLADMREKCEVELVTRVPEPTYVAVVRRAVAA